MTKDKPNIILLMADQLMASRIGAYGCEYAITPHMDELIRQSVKFNAAYTSCPICAPARMSLLSGKYVSNIGCYDNAAVLKADEPCFPHYFSIEGYETALCGKMHMVGPDQQHGFEKRLQTNVYPANFQWLCRRKKGIDHADIHPMPIAIDYLGENTGPRQWSMELDYDEETFFLARKFLAGKCSVPSGTAQKPIPERDNRPFMLTISFNHPHEPFHNLQKFWDIFEDVDLPIPEIPENYKETYSSMDKELASFHGSGNLDIADAESLKLLQRAYMASVAYFDDKVGELMQLLENYGLKDNTIVILTSDHGDMLGARGMVQKRRFYEPSSRIPLAVRIPDGLIDADVKPEIHTPVSICDLFPTMMDLAGIQEWLPVDGQSLVPLMTGEDCSDDRYVFCEQHAEGVSSPNFMIRKGDYKYNLLGKGDVQLFDLKNDPDEWNNLSGKTAYRDIERKMRNLILKHFDPLQIDADAENSVERRWVLRMAHEQYGGPGWNFKPEQDVDHMYWRSENT